MLVFDCNISENCTLYLYFIVTLVIKHAVFLFDCCVIDTRALYLYFNATLVIRARSVLYLIVRLLISVQYSCSLLVR